MAAKLLSTLAHHALLQNSSRMMDDLSSGYVSSSHAFPRKSFNFINYALLYGISRLIRKILTAPGTAMTDCHIVWLSSRTHLSGRDGNYHII